MQLLAMYEPIVGGESFKDITLGCSAEPNYPLYLFHGSLFLVLI